MLEAIVHSMDSEIAYSFTAVLWIWLREPSHKSTKSHIFDEWAADQDPVFKRIFYMEILPALKAKGKTAIVITHDDNYFHMADRCLKLENGMLSELSVIGGQREQKPEYAKINDRYENYAEILP